MLSPSAPGRLVLTLFIAAVLTAGAVVLTVFGTFEPIIHQQSHGNALLWLVLFGAWAIGLVVTFWRTGARQPVGVDVPEATPRLVLSQIEGPTAIPLGGQHIKVWQLWFVNDPVVRAPSAVAPGLTAVVEFQKSHGERPFEPFVGLWAKTLHGDAMGWADSDANKSYYTFAAEVMLPLTPARAKLMLLGQNDGMVTVTVHGLTITMRDVFALPADIVGSASHFQYSKYRVYPDVTRVLVRLHAQNTAEQQFRFALRRDYEGQVVSIAEIPV
jgi:hypothetical protein